MIGLFLTMAAIRVTPAGFESAKEPQVAIEGNSVYVAYGMGDACYVSISHDGGRTYGAPVAIAAIGRLSLGMRRGPRIAVRNRVITVSAVYGDKGKGADGDLLSWTSPDEGKHWGGPVRINDVEGSAREGLHAMAIGSDGTLAYVWLDLRSKGTKLYLSTRNSMLGLPGANRLVAQSPSGSICECCHPSIAFDAKGGIHIMFRNSVEGNRDMYTVSAPRPTAGFSDPAMLGTGHWALDACPMDGGAIALDSLNQVQTVWRRGEEIFQSGDTGAERSLGRGRQPWLAIGKEGDYIVWMNGASIVAKTPSGSSRLAEEGNDPVIASAGVYAIAAWTHNGIEAVVL